MRWLLLALTCAINPPHACRTVVLADYPYADWCESGRQFKEVFPGPGEIKVWCAPKPQKPPKPEHKK